LMIVVSDNVASNLLVDLVGASAVQALMEEAGMTRTTLGRRFMDLPRPGADNRTSASDMGLCLEQLYRGQLLDKAHTSSALAILRRQQYREKIPLLLPPELPVAHKTGELDGVRHDVALVEVPGRPYVLSLLTQKGGPSFEVDLALARISRMIYEIHMEGAQ
jgi:beta-lactamase class A